MERNYSTIFLVIFASNVFQVTCFERLYCFNFTWPASGIEDKNCTKFNKENPHTPCVTPYDSEQMPNTTKLWLDAKNNDTLKQYFCQLEAGNVCIKYTYMYNGAIANVSHFCGKVIEDRTIPITSECYSQHIEGFTVEVCACQPKKENIVPCNKAIRDTYTILIIIMATAVSLFIYKIL